jgi:hypothetical protein
VWLEGGTLQRNCVVHLHCNTSWAGVPGKGYWSEGCLFLYNKMKFPQFFCTAHKTARNSSARQSAHLQKAACWPATAMAIKDISMNYLVAFSSCQTSNGSEQMLVSKCTQSRSSRSLELSSTCRTCEVYASSSACCA